MVVQDYGEAFKRSAIPVCDQGFFLCRQRCDFLHRLLRRMVPRNCLPDEWDWDALCSFDFAVGELFSIPKFIQKIENRAKALKVAGSKIDAERERGKKAKSEAFMIAVMVESFNPFTDQGRQYINYVARELLRDFKSDLVFDLAFFDFALLFRLPKAVAVDCYQHVFQRLNSRGRVARELRNVQMDDYVEFVDDLRHVYLDE